jgi:hypothetical protein
MKVYAFGTDMNNANDEWLYTSIGIAKQAAVKSFMSDDDDEAPKNRDGFVGTEWREHEDAVDQDLEVLYALYDTPQRAERLTNPEFGHAEVPTCYYVRSVEVFEEVNI